jgi:hypothetical protein
MLDFLLVGLLWGSTTPFLRSTKSTKTEETSTAKHLKSLFTDIKFLIPFGLNQLGSIFFYRLLGAHSLAIAAAGANALAFVFSAATETALISRRVPDGRTMIGASLIISGLYLCHQS